MKPLIFFFSLIGILMYLLVLRFESEVAVYLCKDIHSKQLVSIVKESEYEGDKLGFYCERSLIRLGDYYKMSYELK